MAPPPRRGSRGARSLAAALALALVPGAARAQPSPRRPVPDYDGRGAPPATAGEAALWVPRVLLAPLYVVSEFVVRRPLGWLVATAERNQWPTLLVDFFTFGGQRNVGLVPTALLDFGFRPSAGLYFWWDDVAFRGNALRVHAATWGADWLTLTVTDRVRFAGGRATLAVRAEATRRHDLIFAGLGPRSREADRARYGADRLGAGAVVEVLPWRASELRAAAGVRRLRFFDDTCCDEPSVVARANAGAYPLPPGFREGYDVYFQRLEAALDTRARENVTASGLRVEVFAEQAADLADPAARRWAHYGAAVGAFVDLSGTRRALGLVLTAAFVDPLGAGEIPFTELTQLGGEGALRAFRPGRLVGRSAASATLEYRWPVWVWLDGSLHVGVGNVFGPGLGDLSPDLLRMSFGLGLRTRGRPDHSFDLLLAFGTEPFAEGAEVSSVRLVLGARRGF